MSMRNLLSALLFSFALSLLHLNATSPAVVAGESIYQHDWPQLVWSGQFEWESSHMPLTPPGASGYACIQADCEPQKPLTDYSYSELQHALLRKIWWQSKSLSLSALGVSSNWLDAGWSHLIAGFKALIGLTLTMIIAVWSSAIMVFCTVTFWITWNYLTQILRMCLLGVITFYISKGIQWIFGGLFWQMLQLMYALTQRTPSCYDKKKEIQEEQAVEGHIPVIIKQNPPKNAQVLVVHPDGSLAGYATCVRLFNGGLGLITSTHVLKNNHFQSTKTGNRIPTSAFKHLIQGEDLSILRGPPNFESILGCKGVNMVSVKHLGPGPLCHYRYRKSVWEQSSGQLTGSVQGLGIVLSTTDKGDSGASYWNGKNVLGVHRGHPIGENMNILVPIPAVPGITVPVYVYETTAPTGKLFSESEVEEYTSKYTLDLIHKLDDFVPKSGKYWADVVEETTPPPAEQILKPHHSCRRVCEKHENETCTLAYGSFYPCCICYKADQAAGNERGRAVCQNNSNPQVEPKMKMVEETTPASQEPMTLDTLQQKVIAAMVSKINMDEINKSVVAALTQRKRGKRGGKKRRQTTGAGSTKSTTGSQASPSKSPVSGKSENSGTVTTPPEKKNQTGGGNSSGHTQHWRAKQQASAGPSSDPKLKSPA
nr:P1 protein [Grapevine polerovirus 1]UYT09254.1 P1 protein [Grapevine polerovirus 1]